MADILTRVFGDLVARLGGPLHFRFYFQPLMAVVFAAIDGRRDARVGRPPYSWTLLTQTGQRLELMRLGWRSVGKVFILALLLDAIYQVRVSHSFYPGEALIVALALAVVPYLLLRGTVNRLARRKR